jgi:hypothetical protein
MSIKTLVKENYIRANGIRRLATEMELVFSFGRMVQSMKECGEETKLMVEEG